MELLLVFIVVFTGHGVCVDSSFRVVENKLIQPEAQEHCSKYFNGTLHDFQSNMDEIKGEMQSGEQYWAGVIFNYETGGYEKLGGTISGEVEGGHNDGMLCVTAKRTGQRFMFSSSKCCGETAHYFICNTQKRISRHLPGIAKSGIDVNITIDNSGIIEADTGERRHVICDWKIPERFTLPGDTNVVTIKAHNDPGNVGAILASFSNDVVTEESWQCANMDECNSGNCESDANWKPAEIYGNNNAHTHPWGMINEKKINTIKTKAQWIWVSNSQAKRVWCKKTFGEIAQIFAGYTSLIAGALNNGYVMFSHPLPNR